MIWKPIPGHERYMASEGGSILGPRGSVLKPRASKRGYMFVGINGTQKTVHRLVFAAWGHGLSSEFQVNHIDGNKANNAIENLELCSNLENRAHAKRLRLFPHGEGATKVKLTAEIVRQLRSDRSESNCAAARRLGVHEGTVRRARIGENWRYLDVEPTND